MAQRVRIPYRGQGPSSVTQLPILTALHAGFPTLFAFTIHHPAEKVNTNFGKGRNLPMFKLQFVVPMRNMQIVGEGFQPSLNLTGSYLFIIYGSQTFLPYNDRSII